MPGYQPLYPSERNSRPGVNIGLACRVAIQLLSMQLLSMISLLLAALLFLNVSSSSSPTAVEQLTNLRQQAHAAREAGDHRARLEAVLKVQRLLNDAPDAILAAAHAYAEAGDAPQALAALERFAQLGQVDEGLLSGTDRTFAMLQDRPEYKRVLQRFAANKSPISLGERVFMLPDPGILAEDIAYDPRANTFLITSVLEKKILRVTFDGQATDFATSPSHWPMLAVKVDPVHNLVWATEVALDGFTTVPKSDWGRSALLCFDLRTGAVVRRIEGPAKSALGDMALTPEGDPIVSDGDGGGVYRVVDGRLQLINSRDFISPQTPVVLADGAHAFVPDYARGIGLLDLKTSQVAWLNQQQGKTPGRGIDVALNGIDGLYFNRGSLVLTQNGTSPERVIRLRLNQSLTRVVSQEIIEQATTTLGDPTHGVIVADYFYYIANSGWSELDQHGDLKPGSKATPARIMRVIL